MLHIFCIQKSSRPQIICKHMNVIKSMWFASWEDKEISKIAVHDIRCSLC